MSQQQQQYLLRWNNHQPNFISVFTALLNSESLVDVTLAAEGRHLQAHKVVLSACSVYFQTLFTANPSRHPIVILKDVKYTDLRTMVDFMYYGEVNVSQEQLPQILETAKMLKIKGLTEMSFPASSTNSQNASSAEVPAAADQSWEPQRRSISPCNLSPSSMKRRRLLKVNDNSKPSLQLVKGGGTITLSNLTQNKQTYQDCMKEPEENGATAPLQQNNPDQTNNLGVDQAIDHSPCLPQASAGQWGMVDQSYQRYSNSPINNSLQSDSTMAFMNNAMNHHIVDINDYAQGVNLTGPTPGLNCVSDAQGTTGLSQQNVPPKRRRTSNPQSEENFQRALEAVRFGGIGFCKAARMFGVNNRTLWLEYKKKGYPNNRPSIKNRIKREHASPPPENKEELPQPDPQMALFCPPHPMPVVGFIDSRQMDFPTMQSVAHSPLNLHGINFNTMQ